MISRRTLLKNAAALAASGFALGRVPSALAAAMAGTAPTNDRILVVLELSGGNDGLNTVVPYGNDTYYKLRPTIGIKADKILKLDEHWGLNPGLLGFERLWKEGQLAVVHGVGYANPSFSHFTSMAYWHTASPNSGDEYGWCGRLADSLVPEPRPNFLINVDTAQSLAVKARIHTPVVFDEPDRFQRRTLTQERGVIEQVAAAPSGNPARDYLNMIQKSAAEASTLVREAWANYKTPIDYGLAPLQLPKVAACINAGLPARIYYLAFRNNAFDTHVQQSDLHQRLLSYAADAVHGFIRDLERQGNADRVSLMMFSEFGRRAPENTNRGTDHGAANLMYFVGKGVKGGHYGTPSNLGALDAGDNLVYSTDFRQVYATAIEGWMQSGTAATVLKGAFNTLPVFT